MKTVRMERSIVASPIRFLIAAGILLVLLTGTAVAQIPTYPWAISTPEEQGMNAELLDAMLAHIEETQPDIHSITIIRNGQMVFDAYFENDDFGRNALHPVCSCTKSVMGLLIGIAIENGFIESVDVPVLGFFPDRTFEQMTSTKERMTLEHLLTMSAGFACFDDTSDEALETFAESRDRIQYLLDQPMRFTPGLHFVYCNGMSYLLSAILTIATDMSAANFAYEHLFRPLGIINTLWGADGWGGFNLGHTDLYLRPHDMAKIGQLCLNEGRWDGKQVVPTDWIAASTSRQINAGNGAGGVGDTSGYGYQWWVDPSGYYFAFGLAAQFIYVLPAQDMVVVFTCKLFDEGQAIPGRLLHEYIIPAAG